MPLLTKGKKQKGDPSKACAIMVNSSLFANIHELFCTMMALLAKAT